MSHLPVNWLRSFLLVASGAAAGSVGTLAVQRWARLQASGPAVSEAGTHASPARESALNRRTGDHGVKLAQILDADDREHKSSDLRRLGSEACGEDAAAALRMAAGIPGEADRADYLRGVVEAMASRDAAATAAFALEQFSPGALQAEAVRLAMAAWGATSARDAYAWAMANLNGPMKDEAVNALVTNWAARSPQQAARWFEETGSTSQTLLAAVVSGWAAKSPADAAGWVETLPDAANREAGRLVAAREWAAQRPEEAVAAYPNPEPALASVLADIWGTSRPADAARWIDALPAGPGREEAAATLATVWAASDVQAAAAWSSGLADPGARAAAVEHLATTWGAIDPDKAIAWVETQPEPLRGPGFAGAYNSWAGTDPEGLRDWIGQLPAGPQTDVARRSLGEVRAASDPAAAMDLTLGMTPAAQADAAGRWFRGWRRVDDAAAQDWLETNWASLPDVTKARLGREQARTAP